MRTERRIETAELVSKLLGPVPMGVVLGLAVGVHSGRGVLAGAGWGLLSVVCAAVLPAVATAPLRRREARTPSLRLTYMAPAIAGALVGLLILWRLSAPSDVRVLALGFALGLIGSGLVNTVYASSNHVAALGGGGVLAGALIAPWLLPLGLAFCGAQSWSRIVLQRHTLTQTFAGAIVGIGTATVAYLLAS